jgi:ABC-2 type transport system ATP-binding protein
MGTLPATAVSISEAMTPPLQADQVWKSYGTIPAVRGLNLLVPAGAVYGFLGPNGAGKSTTIRMILGLQRPDRGRILLFGRPVEDDRLKLLARVGSLVESPSLYLHLTGHENLEIHRRLLNASGRAISDALDTVGLSYAADRIVRNYSTGMKQRLGLAQALLGNPELLLLDEPTNGLDPAGIHEVRTLIRDLPRRRGVTIFLCSHLLAEVEQVATHLAIISAGEAKFQGTPEELRLQSRSSIVVRVDQQERAIRILQQHGIMATCQESQLLISEPDQFTASDINDILVRFGVAVSELTTRRPSLEDLFFNLTAEQKEPAIA